LDDHVLMLGSPPSELQSGPRLCGQRPAAEG
jgi:hypothetical protein